MDPLEKLFNDIETLRVRAETLTASLPPDEQFEGTPEVRTALRNARSGYKLIIDGLAAFTAAKQQTTTEVAAKIRTGLVAAGEMIDKATHTAAVTAAVSAKELELKNTFTAAEARNAQISQRRREAVSVHKLPALVAEKMGDDCFVGDGFPAACVKVQARLEQLKPFSITAEKAPKVIEDVAVIPVTAEGDVTFAARMAVITETVTASRAAAGGGGDGGGNPLAGASASGRSADGATLHGVKSNLL